MVKEKIETRRMMLRTILCMTLVLHVSLAYGEQTQDSSQISLPTTYTELLEWYERAIAAGKNVQIPDDVLERAKEEIKRVGTWEYRVVTLSTPQDATLQQRLNELGRERWECHATLRGDENVRLVCKRPVRSYLKNIAVTDLLKLIP